MVHIYYYTSHTKYLSFRHWSANELFMHLLLYHRVSLCILIDGSVFSKNARISLVSLSASIVSTEGRSPHGFSELRSPSTSQSPEKIHPGHGVPIRRRAKAGRKRSKSPPWNPCGCSETLCPVRTQRFGLCVSETGVTRRTRSTPAALVWTVWQTGTGGADAEHFRGFPWCKTSQRQMSVASNLRCAKRTLTHSLDVDCATTTTTTKKSIPFYSVVIMQRPLLFFVALSKKLSALHAAFLWWPLCSH